MNFEYKISSIDDLEKIWAKNIADNLGDDRWITWKHSSLKNHAAGRSLTFVITANNDPIGEGTLIFDPNCEAISNRLQLADGSSIANVNALRIQKEYEGQGHISKLVKSMELYAKSKGYSYLSIGVDAQETRNLAIYLHWKYNEFIHFEKEDGELVLYYRKKL